MEHLSEIIGHLAWPLSTLAISFLVVRELKSGLVSHLLPNGGTVKAAGIEVEIKAATLALAAAGVKPAEHKATQDQDQVIEDESPYETVISAWREVSYQIANLAALHGGRKDARKSYENITVLESKALLPSEVANAARSLFKARNSFRRLSPDEVTAEIASEFVANTEALSGYIKLVS